MAPYIYIFIFEIEVETRADPRFVVKGGVSMRGIWGPFKVPGVSRTEPL
jgi:hypothetical protein